MDLTNLITELSKGFASFTWGNAVMILVGLILIYLAIVKAVSYTHLTLPTIYPV